MATPQVVPLPAMDAAQSFSPVENEAPVRWQRAVHLAPSNGLGTARRAVFFALLTWLPIALWALMRGRFVDAAIGEPLLTHYGVHVRCLVAIPLFILGEAMLQNAAQRHYRQFIGTGIVDDATRPRFEAVMRTARRWHDATLPWLFVAGAALAWTIADGTANYADELSWATDSSGVVGFGGWWLAYVVRPIFLGLLLGWLWRIALLVVLFAGLGRLRLSIIPSHPDRAGGLGFLEKLPAAFAPVSFGLSAMLVSRWAHQMVYHGQTVQALKMPAAMFVVVWSLLLLLPLIALLPLLRSAKRSALPSYAALVAEQSRLVRQRWIDGTTKVDAPLLEPAGVGPIADAAAMFNAVRAMRVLLIGKSALAGILLPVAVPMLAGAALQIPIGKLLLGIIKTLM